MLDKRARDDEISEKCDFSRLTFLLLEYPVILYRNFHLEARICVYKISVYGWLRENLVFNSEI